MLQLSEHYSDNRGAQEMSNNWLCMWCEWTDVHHTVHGGGDMQWRRAEGASCIGQQCTLVLLVTVYDTHRANCQAQQRRAFVQAYQLPVAR